MKKLFFAVTMCLAVSSISFAQIKVVKQAKSMANTPSNIKAAKKIIKEAMSNDETKNLAETWDVAGLICKKYYDEEIKNAFLKKPYDTAGVYNSVLEMFKYYNQCDKLAQQPDAKGKVKNPYRKPNSLTLLGERGQLINGGVYHYNSGNNKQALNFFAEYVESASYDMLAEHNLVEKDTLVPQIAFYTLVAAERLEDNEAIKRYAPFAVKDPENGKFALQTLAEVYKNEKDTVNFIKYLNKGTELFPTHDYFYAGLVDIYVNTNKIDEAMKVADKMVVAAPNNKLSVYIKGFLLHNNKQYDEAIEMYKKAIELDPEHVDAYSNIGLAYLMKAQDVAEKMPTDMKDPKYKELDKKVKELYALSKPYYEKARELAPEKENLWLQGLYRVYYNLNMEKEYEEIERLLPK